jgi:hypothetical protein
MTGRFASVRWRRPALGSLVIREKDIQAGVREGEWESPVITQATVGDADVILRVHGVLAPDAVSGIPDDVCHIDGDAVDGPFGIIDTATATADDLVDFDSIVVIVENPSDGIPIREENIGCSAEGNAVDRVVPNLVIDKRNVHAVDFDSAHGRAIRVG